MSILGISPGSLAENIYYSGTKQTLTFYTKQLSIANDKTFTYIPSNEEYIISSDVPIWYTVNGTKETFEESLAVRYSYVYFFSQVPTTFTVVRKSDSREWTFSTDVYYFEDKEGNKAYFNPSATITVPKNTKGINPAVYCNVADYNDLAGTKVTYPYMLGAAALFAIYGYTPPDPYDAGSSGETTGGGGGVNSPDLGGDTVGVPSLPSVSVTDSGFISLYTGSEGQIKALADYLWTDLLNVQEVVEALKRLVADPMKLIIGLSIVPSQGLNVGASVPVKVGFFDTGLNLTRLNSQFFTVDCGTIKFNTVCGNTFLDYAPYSKFSIYLPFIGTRSVDANDFVNHTIGVKYHCDALTGNCTCYVTKDNSVMYQYSGSLSVNCPLSSQDFTSTIISAVQMAAAGVGIVASGGTATAGLLAGASAGASQIASNPSMLSPNVAHSGAVSGCAGMLGVLTPFVIREAPTYQSTKNFNTETGYPSNIYIQLGECTGYTQIQDIHLTGIDCTQSELDEIEQLLKAGVIF